MEDRRYWLGFSLIPDIGPRRLLQLRDVFGSLKDAWFADEAALLQAGLGKALVTQIITARSKIDLDRELKRITRVDSFFLTMADDNYPSLLKDIEDPPPVLYARGSITPADDRALCIVGTRRATVYGKDAAYSLARDLAANGVTIISGLAQGIDSAAHQGALDGGGRTIGILGCGISQIYPHESLDLAHKIIRNGAVLTEFHIGTPPIGHNFPRRNRIMSGMALGILVVEAGERSGALITASLAAEQGRDVFAIPSNIFNIEGRGVNKLIQDGAKLVMSAKDILDEIDETHYFAQARTQTEQIAPENDTEKAIANCLSSDPIHIDDIVRASGLPVATVSSTLTILELKGLARNVGSMQYTRSH